MVKEDQMASSKIFEDSHGCNAYSYVFCGGGKESRSLCAKSAFVSLHCCSSRISHFSKWVWKSWWNWYNFNRRNNSNHSCDGISKNLKYINSFFVFFLSVGHFVCMPFGNINREIQPKKRKTKVYEFLWFAQFSVFCCVSAS